MSKAELGKKILIVDDQTEVRSLLNFALSNMNYRLFMASDGNEALNSYRMYEPDIVILDIMMPGDIDGLEVCKTLKKEENPPIVIFLSALCQPDDIERGRESGGDAYITKPFSPMTLIRQIHKLVQHG